MRRAVSWGAWWFVLFWAWLLYNGQWTHVELVAAASAGAVGATAAEVVRTQALHRLCFRRQHLVRFWRPLWEIFPQFLDVGARALALPFSDRRGAFVTQDVGGPTGSEVTSKSSPSARMNVWYRQWPPSAIAARPAANRSGVDIDCTSDAFGATLCLLDRSA